MNDAIQEKLKGIFVTIFPGLGVKDFSLEEERTRFEAWDSLAHMQIVSEIESNFGVTFEMDEIAVIAKPADFIDLISKKLSHNSDAAS